MERNQVDVRKSLLKLQDTLSGSNVETAVIVNLIELIPEGICVAPTKMSIFVCAAKQLCAADNVEQIDWLRLIGLSADICRLWNSGWTK